MKHDGHLFVCVFSHSVVSDSLQPYGLSMGFFFFRQEYRSGLPFPSTGDLPISTFMIVIVISNFSLLL